MSALISTDSFDIPRWVDDCLSWPKKGVSGFLNELCNRTGARYAHIRIPSRLKKYYMLIDSIGPYERLGWRRRFQFMDGVNRKVLSYQFIDYQESEDRQRLQQKYAQDSKAFAYFNSLVYGLWIPLDFYGMDFGYVILSWDHGKPDKNDIVLINDYMGYVTRYIPLLFAACRSVIANKYLQDLWNASSIILSAPTEAQCYQCIAAAGTKLWGPDSTTYIGKPDYDSRVIQIVAVDGYEFIKNRVDNNKQSIPFGKGLLYFALESLGPVVSYTLPRDQRFEYFSMTIDEKIPGSAMACKLSDTSDQMPICLFSVEHERDGYFDDDDLRYLIGLSRIGFSALKSHKRAEDRLAQEIDTLFVQMAHEVQEPLQAAVADADVLQYNANNLLSIKDQVVFSKILDDISHRSANILETCSDLSKVVRNHLDSGIYGAATKVIAGRVNIFRILVSMLDKWAERAATHNVYLNPLFTLLKGVYIQCDEAELKSALGHLIGNAIKYSYSGGRLWQGTTKQGSTKYDRYVTIRGRTGLGNVIIEIQNLGVGILKHELLAVKTKFYRGELAIKEGRAGTGRGLWIATTFFESIGGSVEITSEYKGTGSLHSDGPYLTTVKVTMPCIIPEEA